ncbi:hypothetical protein ABZS76_15745 [Streptomyces sp. NPDC005562]|uniref:hypothetical protein n=1 Tax=Streptomyces sp. NPDC005562 TaxID=3154890 RepID=UPI0033A80754
MTESALEILRTRPDLAELAAFPFNFDLDRAYHVEEVHLASGASLEAIAGDDTGGTYFLCGGREVLHASSDGYASLVAGSVEEALEILIRLPWWCEDVSADMTEEELHAAVREGDEEARSEFAPDLDAQRATLLHGLGLPDRPLTELVALDEAATANTEPDHLLLNSAELCAYQLEESYRQPLRDIVLGPGRAALERARSGAPDAWEPIAEDVVLCEGVLRAAGEDRQARDLPLLRFLLERACAGGERWPEGRRMAAALVAAYGQEADVPLLGEATAGQVTDSTRAVEWARAEAAEQDEFTWIELARRQGRTENARVALIRMLDDTGPQADRLRRLSRALERLGDHAQAARAQSHLVSLQDTDEDRAAEAHILARLERLTRSAAVRGERVPLRPLE